MTAGFLDQGRGGRTRTVLKRGLHRLFRSAQRAHVDVLPRHFYSAIPDVESLRRDSSWRVPSSMPGVRGVDLDAQMSELASWFSPEVSAHLAEHDVHAEAMADNGAHGFGPAEAQLLHAFVAAKRPSRVIQVGAGVSTAVILRAAEMYGTGTRVTCIDPYPTEYLLAAAASGKIDLIHEGAQRVPLDVFTSLGPGDLLFVDSTHTVKPGSEVNRIVLEVLPLLPRDAVVHFHDIWFPYDYQRDVLESALFFWAESTLLHAFLIGNDRMRILVSASMLQYGRLPDLRTLLPRFDPRDSDRGLDVPGDLRDFAGSTYLLVDGA